MGKRDKQKSSAEERVNEGPMAAASPSRHEVNTRANMDEGSGLTMILEELRDFRREFQEFKSDLVRANNRITEAETRIAKLEDRVQNAEQVMLKMLKIINEQENKIVDQESRARRKNLRLYNVPEGVEGSSMTVFVEKVLTECLDLPQGTELGIERSHRAPGAVRNREGTPRSILICFARYNTKEEVLRKAWAKRTVLLNGQKIYFDQDYAPAILRKRKGYAEAKRALKQQNIRFQTPYPAKLRVFYQEGTMLYATAEEATADMRTRGFQIDKVAQKQTLTEQLSNLTWAKIGKSQRCDSEGHRESPNSEQLQLSRRCSPSTTGD